MEELYQKQCGSRWELFCIESGCWFGASRDRKVKECCGLSLGTLKWGQLNSWSLYEFSQGEPEESQQRKHYKNQAWRQQAKKGEFWWIQKKYTVGLNRSAWSTGKQVDRVCSPVPSMQGVCQKWHQGYELHWKMGWNCDPHIVKKEDQFQVHSLLRTKCEPVWPSRKALGW